MEFFKHAKDGGPESNVEGYWLIEWKNGFSIALLKFNKGHREAFHSHAFNAWSWFIKGEALEYTLKVPGRTIETKWWRGMCLPKYTPRKRFHRYLATKTTWCLTVRCPWNKTWQEITFEGGGMTTKTLTHGRKVMDIYYSR